MKTVAFDVDGTLIYQGGNLEDSPRYEVINIFKYFKSIGCRMVIFSGGGIPYAERWAQKLGLEAEIWEKTKSDSIDIVFDDQEVDLGKVNIKV